MNGELLREAMRQWASGVAVVTTAHQGIPHGITVSSFDALSLDPPVVAITLKNTTPACQYILEGNVFGVNILSASQKDLANTFSIKDIEGVNRFQNVGYTECTHGVPILDGSMAYFCCMVRHTHLLNQKTLILGDVLYVKVNDGQDPLLYFNQAYRTLMK